MAKQEEIREGIKDSLLFDMKLISPMVSKELEFNANELAKEILTYLHSKGVVIKVDKELPRFKVKNRHPEELKIGWHVQRAMLDAGFTATEPLIKEE